MSARLLTARGAQQNDAQPVSRDQTLAAGAPVCNS